MVSTKVIRVYICSHVEVDHVEEHSGETSMFVFHEGPCSKPSCVETYAAGFISKGKQPLFGEWEQLEELESQFWRNKAHLGATLKLFDSLKPLYDIELARVILDPDISGRLNLVDREKRKGEIDKWLNLPETAALLEHAREFKQPHQRPFFDFARNGVSYYIEGATVRIGKLQEAVQTLQEREKLLTAAQSLAYRWPDSSVDYEPDFGAEHLDLLRSTAEGRSLLQQPISEFQLCRTSARVHQKRELDATSSSAENNAPTTLPANLFHGSREVVGRAFRAVMAAAYNRRA